MFTICLILTTGLLVTLFLLYLALGAHGELLAKYYAEVETNRATATRTSRIVAGPVKPTSLNAFRDGSGR